MAPFAPANGPRLSRRAPSHFVGLALLGVRCAENVRQRSLLCRRAPAGVSQRRGRKGSRGRQAYGAGGGERWRDPCRDHLVRRRCQPGSGGRCPTAEEAFVSCPDPLSGSARRGDGRHGRQQGPRSLRFVAAFASRGAAPHGSRSESGAARLACPGDRRRSAAGPPRGHGRASLRRLRRPSVALRCTARGPRAAEWLRSGVS